MTDCGYTVARTLIRACEIGKQEGLRYVYAGNLPGTAGDWENTRCPNCQELLIERRGFEVQNYYLTDDAKCPKCATVIPGRWDAAKTRAALERFDMFDRRPRAGRPA
jgi:pyruvate formate lyase activating enzyme